MTLRWRKSLIVFSIFYIIVGIQTKNNEFIRKDAGRCYETDLEDSDWFRQICKNWRYDWWETVFSVVKLKIDGKLALEINGNYDWEALEKFLLRNPRHALDMPEYLGPVEVVPVPGKGEGLVATAEIKPGQLIIASKAVAHVFSDDDTMSLIDPVTDLPELFNDIVGSMSSNSKQYKELEQHFGKDKPFESMVTNQDGDPALHYQFHKFESLDRSLHGIWYYPSYLNHNCYLANSNWRMYGDFMMVRATKHIPKGSEVLMAYGSQTNSYEARRDMAAGWGFQCDCQLCQADRADPPQRHSRRKEIYARLMQSSNIKESAALVKEIAAMRKFRLNYPLIPAISLYINHLQDAGQYEAAYNNSKLVYKLVNKLTTFKDHEEPIGLISRILKLNCIHLRKKYKEEEGGWIEELIKWVDVKYGSFYAWMRTKEYLAFSNMAKLCDL